MKTLLISLAVLFALAGCASSSGASSYDKEPVDLKKEFPETKLYK